MIGFVQMTVFYNIQNIIKDVIFFIDNFVLNFLDQDRRESGSFSATKFYLGEGAQTVTASQLVLV